MIKHLKDEDLLFVALYEKSEGEEYIVENFNDGNDFLLNDEQWGFIVEKMDQDENLWVEVSESFRHYLEKIYNQTKEEG